MSPFDPATDVGTRLVRAVAGLIVGLAGLGGGIVLMFHGLAATVGDEAVTRSSGWSYVLLGAVGFLIGLAALLITRMRVIDVDEVDRDAADIAARAAERALAHSGNASRTQTAGNGGGGDPRE